MKKSTKIIVIIISVILVIGIIAFFFFSQGEWCETQGWTGEHNKDSAYLEGVEGLELQCSKDTRIVYSYAIKSGGAQLKLTRDAAGNDIVELIEITGDNDSGTITFDSAKPEVYYLFETALSKDSDYIADGRCEEYRTKWRQMILRLAFRLGIDME